MRYVYQNPSEHLDSETVQMLSVLDKIPAEDRPNFQARIKDRVERVVSGINRYPHIDTALKEYCPELRTRFDFERGKLIIEHYHPQTAWQMIGGGEWPEDDNGNPLSSQSVIEKLRAGDMQQKGHKKYMEEKKEAAAKIVKENERQADQNVLAAVDSLSSKQVAQFVEVSKALSTGEDIKMFGPDAKHLDRAQKHGKKMAEALGADLPKAIKLDRLAQIKYKSKRRRNTK